MVVKLLHEEIPKIERNVKWDGMYDLLANKIIKLVDEIQEGK